MNIAVARMPEQLDLFVAGSDGGVYSAWWNRDLNGAQWSPWFPIV